jgi:hypothetical protein
MIKSMFVHNWCIPMKVPREPRPGVLRKIQTELSLLSPILTDVAMVVQDTCTVESLLGSSNG